NDRWRSLGDCGAVKRNALRESQMQRARLKIVRRLGTPLPGLTRKDVTWKTYPPGAHGPTPRKGRSRISGYGQRLQEKQKLRWHYGISERQLQAAFEEASSQP